MADIDDLGDFDDFDPETSELEEAEMNCGRTSSGGCTLYGSEWCDWDCPFSDKLEVNRALRQRHKRKDPRQLDL